MPPKKIHRLVHIKDHGPSQSGFLSKTFLVNGDSYSGEWSHNLKHGKGSFYWKKTGNLYDGDWIEDHQDGYGALSVLKKNGVDYRKQYIGGWKLGRKHGFGINLYTSVVVYEGEWNCGKRHGWGKMVYSNGTVYEGEWFNDMLGGSGMARYVNGHRYEGSYKNGKKHGHGRYYFTDKCQVYDGVWVDGVAKCGMVLDINRKSAKYCTEYPIPKIALAHPDLVLQQAEEHFIPTEYDDQDSDD